MDASAQQQLQRGHRQGVDEIRRRTAATTNVNQGSRCPLSEISNSTLAKEKKEKSQTVIDYLRDRCSITFKESEALGNEHRKKAEAALMGLKVRVTHRKSSQRYTVRGLTKNVTDDIAFEVDKRMTPLVKFFRQKYNRTIRYGRLPCLDLSKSQSKPNYVPLELCVISSEDTAVSKKLQRRISPTTAAQETKFQFFTRLRSQVTPLLQTSVLLKPPFREDRKLVVDGVKIDKWGLLFFTHNPSSWPSTTVHKFISAFAEKCTKLGINMNRKPIICKPSSIKNLSAISDLKKALSEVQSAATGQLEVLICVLEKKHDAYKSLLLIAETEMGLLTQCCMLERLTKYFSNHLSDQKLIKQASSFLASLALKINAKLGASNAVSFRSPLPPHLSKAMFVGGRLSHTGEDNPRSVAAVVGSWQRSTKYIARIRYQASRSEHIQYLGDMFKELLQEYKELNKSLPNKILFFRGGVSDGQVHRVLNLELLLLEEAFRSFEGSYDPQISFIFTRKMTQNRREAQGSTNKEKRPKSGAEKPTQYSFLLDENKFRENEFQELMKQLCNTCGRRISVAPPLYYAHLGAHRGKLYLEALASCKQNFNLCTVEKSIEKTIFFS